MASRVSLETLRHLDFNVCTNFWLTDWAIGWLIARYMLGILPSTVMVASVLWVNITATRVWLCCRYSDDVIFSPSQGPHHFSLSYSFLWSKPILLTIQCRNIPYFHESLSVTLGELSYSSNLTYIYCAWWHVDTRNTRWMKHENLCSSWRNTYDQNVLYWDKDFNKI